MQFNSMSDFNILFHFLDLILVVGLSAFEFIDVFQVDVLCMGCDRLFPASHCIKLSVSLNAVVCSV